MHANATIRLAVVMTCRNTGGHGTTPAALDALARQRGLPPGTEVRVHLVDTGSTDGTPQAVRRAHPDVDVMSLTGGSGSGSGWGQGMRVASRNSRAAGREPFTHQLWLHDSVLLDEDALARLLATARVLDGAVLVGAVHDGTRTTYSGRTGRDLLLVEPDGPGGRPEPCRTYDGKVVLLPRAVRDRIGDIDRRFPHGMGDHDHGFRARKAGIPAYVAPGHVGRCPAGPPRAASREPGIGVREALRRVTSAAELPPRAWWVYCRRHTGPWAPVRMLAPYVGTAVRAGVGRWG